MIPIMCLVQEGQVSAKVESALKSKLRAFVVDAFDKQSEIDWIEVPAGAGFTGGSPSSSVLVSMHADINLAEPLREKLLRTLYGICQEITCRERDELVVAIRDPKSDGE